MKHFDLFSSSPELLIYGSNRFSTTLGILMTILTYLACFTLGIWFFQDWLSNSKSTIIKSENYNESGEIELSSYPIVFAILDGNLNPLPDEERLLGLDVLTADYRGSEPIIKKVDFKKCTKDSFGPFSASIENTNNIDSYFCIEPNKSNLTLGSNYGSSIGFRYLNIDFNKCVNGTNLSYNGELLSNRTDCFSDQEREKRLADVFLKYIYIDYKITHDQVTPQAPEVKNFLMPISIKLFKRIFVNFSVVKYITDIGIMMKSENIETFFQAAPREVTYDLTNSNLKKFSQVSILGSGNEITYSRSYPKVQQLIANIGGVFGGLTLFSQAIVIFFTKSILYLELANIFFYFPNQTENNKKNQFSEKGVNNSQMPINLDRNNLGKESDNPNIQINQNNFSNNIQVNSVFVINKQNKETNLKNESFTKGKNIDFSFFNYFCKTDEQVLVEKLIKNRISVTRMIKDMVFIELLKDRENYWQDEKKINFQEYKLIPRNIVN